MAKICKYQIKGDETLYTYEALVKALKTKASSAYDILYSLDYNKLDRIVDKLNDLKEKGKIKFSKETSNQDASILDGCAEINTKEYTLQSFIDSSRYVDEFGNPYMPPLKINEFIDRQVISYRKKGMSEEEIVKHTEILKRNWQRMANDGRDFHKIILGINGDRTSYTDVENLAKDTSFDHLCDLIYGKVEKEIFKLVKLKHGKFSKEYGDESKTVLIKNINLRSDVLGSDKLILGHIDYIIIKPDGSLEIYNIKSSHESYAFWDRAKKEKYQHEGALLAKILLNNGFSIKNIRFNIVPVVFDYNDDVTSIENIRVQKAECISHKNDSFIMWEQIKNVSRFIESGVEQLEITNENIDIVNKLLNAVFPKKGIKADGIINTIEDYIDKNWKYWIRGELPAKGYNLLIKGKLYHVNDSKIGSANKELVALITKNQIELIDDAKYGLTAESIIGQLNDFRRNGFPNFNSPYLNQFFLPYFESTLYTVKGDKKFQYKWDIIDNEMLKLANVLVFQNRDTKLLNIIMLSSLNIDKSILFEGNKNILGFHISDNRALDNLGHMLMQATYGNIETMRALFLLNEVLPQLSDVKLGDVSVIGGLGTNIKGQTIPIEMAITNFVKASEVINSKEPQLKIKNNFKDVEHVSMTQLLINDYYNILHESSDMESSPLGDLKDLIMGSDTDGLQHFINGTTEDSLQSAETNEIRILRLSQLIDKLLTILKDKKISLSPDNLIKLANNRISASPLIKDCCKLLINATLTLDRLSGIIRINQADLTTTDAYFAKALNIDNTQVRIVGKLLQDAIHNVAYKMDPELSDFNILCLDYYKARGYGAVENAVIGNLAKVFKHLYKQVDDELFLKNPYDMSEPDLDDMDRKFLKKVLFIFNKIRFRDDNFSYTNENDPALKTFINKNSDKYFLVPLERASKATRWLNPIEYSKDFKRRAGQYCKNPSLFFREMYEGILTDKEHEQVSRDIEDMLAYNAFKASNTKDGRKRLFDNYGKNYFETNLQNLVIDYIHKDILELEMSKMLLKTKGILLYLKISGERDNDPKKFNEIINYIEDYLKVSVYNKSIMNEDTLKIVARVLPLRKMITKVYIAASPVAAVRDVMGGFLSNTVRALTKFRSDIDVKDVLWGYQYIMRKGVHSALNIDFLDKLNSKYSISNINVESLLEGYKTNRGGIRNIDNWLYATLRKPDYLNRMVLFLAHLHHDGSDKAYSLVDKKLVYNWRMDKRYNLLANNDTSNMAEYNKQKSLYLSQLIKFNQENPYNQLEVSLNTDMPDGYTLNLVETIKNMADSIYGSYSISTKAKYESTAIGSQLGVFSTWLNGIYDVYFGRRRESSYETKKVQAEDVNGNKLWIDDLGNVTTINTGVAYLVDIPLIVLGVLRTLGDTFSVIYHKLWKGFKEDIWNDPMQMRNWRRALTDALMSLLMYLLFEYAIDPAYEEHKKNDSGLNVASNIMWEILYKGSSSCFEEFHGPFPILEYAINNTKPSAAQWGVKFTTDVYQLAFGDKTFGNFIMNMLALPRSLRDSYNMYVRDTKNGISEV